MNAFMPLGEFFHSVGAGHGDTSQSHDHVPPNASVDVPMHLLMNFPYNGTPSGSLDSIKNTIHCARAQPDHLLALEHNKIFI